MTIMFAHDNDVSNLFVGKKINKGDYIIYHRSFNLDKESSSSVNSHLYSFGKIVRLLINFIVIFFLLK